MCTLIAAVQTLPESPLVIAANRDERLDRPAAGPRLWPGSPAFIAPVDQAAGGTWLGLNAAGVFVGVTNRFGVERDDSRESRGRLVVEALSFRSARALHTALEGLSPKRFNAFHLFYSDATAAFVTWSTGDRINQESLLPGVHIITERSLGGDDRDRTELIRSYWPSVEKGPGQLTDRLGDLLRLQRDPPGGGVCIHAPALNYGTRSSLVLLLQQNIGESEFLWANGPPCVTKHEDRSDLLRQLALAD
jgi:uncharacterized protein with NRDE domain